MARGPVARDLDPQPYGILIVVDPCLDHLLNQPGRRTLVPKGLARAAIVMRFAGLQRLFQRQGIHPAQHQHLARTGIGGDTGHQAPIVEFGGKLGAFLDLLDRGSLAEIQLIHAILLR